ncbi:hypothetical protein DFH08DRAFT_959953 [Mycena albidolilacea]|uniref:Uncharacterized protein n=1 Tax=Mycena albidolilacea TaxID=1033008 RepID=A0AAD7A435_9AGAR|nr:hypothetical protein DFH08DRAFT_959953 [Mycena albidolilacea]
MPLRRSTVYSKGRCTVCYNVVVPTIALSVPTTDVAVGTSVDCQWTSGATDPATFSLVMQFSNSGSPQFGDLAAVTVVQHGTTTSGTIPNIKSVAVLGMHRLAAYPDPFDSSAPGQPFSVSPAFNVIANSSQSFSTTDVVEAPTSILPTNASTSTSVSTSSSRSKNHNTIIIAVVVICVVLALAMLGLLLLLRRRRRKNAGMSDIARLRSLVTEDLGLSGAATFNAPPSDIARFTTGPVSHRREKMVQNRNLVPERSLPDRGPDHLRVHRQNYVKGL